jgi:hypothetical protein
VATASTRVPPAVASDEIVCQSATDRGYSGRSRRTARSRLGRCPRRGQRSQAYAKPMLPPNAVIGSSGLDLGR